MKLNWNEAPEWANYFAIDLDGYSYWFENKPKIDHDYSEWVAYGRVKCFDSKLFCWTDSLEQRPQEE